MAVAAAVAVVAVDSAEEQVSAAVVAVADLAEGRVSAEEVVDWAEERVG